MKLLNVGLKRAAAIAEDGNNNGSTSKRSKTNSYEASESPDFISSNFQASASNSSTFQLDDFQKEGIAEIRNDNSLLVSAPTSAGKTVLAEDAVDMALEHGKRVFITAPTKALANQHFKSFKQKFPNNVGLITGDTSINVKAPCLIVVPEILRSMIYKNHESIEGLMWIVFDEIQSISDRNRGGVYEEIIIAMRLKANFLLLTATIGNVSQFADWISSVQSRKCQVVIKRSRPVPLQYYVVPKKLAIEFVKIKDDDNPVDIDKFKSTMNYVKNYQMTENMFMIESVKAIIENEMQPCIYFSFVKAVCDKFANYLNANFEAVSQTPIVTEKESQKIQGIWNAATQGLSEEDRSLVQVETIYSLVIKGIGIHHAGLLPALKEIVEMLCSHGLLKIIFATSTLAIGINMPVKSVVFTSIYMGNSIINKIDFMQMAGRVGRRGMDKVGNIVLLDCGDIDEKLVKKLMEYKCDNIRSNFSDSLSYASCLNFLIRYGKEAEEMMIKSLEHVLRLQIRSERINKLNDEFDDYLILFERFEKIKKEVDYLFNSDSRRMKHRSQKTLEALKLEERLQMKLRDHSVERYYKYSGKENFEKLRWSKILDIKERCEEYFPVYKFNEKIKVMRSLGYVKGDTVTEKGLIASRIFTSDALIATELLSNGFFDNLSPSYSAACLSCLISNVDGFKHFLKNDKRNDFIESIKQMNECLKSLKKHGYSEDKRLMVGRIDAVYFWLNDSSFNGLIDECKCDPYKVCKCSIKKEPGSLVQFFHQLSQLLNEMSEAAKSMGKESLANNFKEVAEKSIRKIVAFESLHTKSNDAILP